MIVIMLTEIMNTPNLTEPVNSAAIPQPMQIMAIAIDSLIDLFMWFEFALIVRFL
jgi:hypothetical protein